MFDNFQFVTRGGLYIVLDRFMRIVFNIWQLMSYSLSSLWSLNNNE